MCSEWICHALAGTLTEKESRKKKNVFAKGYGGWEETVASHLRGNTPRICEISVCNPDT
jgi:hypothetical protein